MKKIFNNKKCVKNPHKPDCILRDRGDFTIIQNNVGLKISECHKKFCPCCGVKLK